MWWRWRPLPMPSRRRFRRFCAVAINGLAALLHFRQDHGAKLGVAFDPRFGGGQVFLRGLVGPLDALLIFLGQRDLGQIGVELAELGDMLVQAGPILRVLGEDVALFVEPRDVGLVGDLGHDEHRFGHLVDLGLFRGQVVLHGLACRRPKLGILFVHVNGQLAIRVPKLLVVVLFGGFPIAIHCLAGIVNLAPLDRIRIRAFQLVAIFQHFLTVFVEHRNPFGLLRIQLGLLSVVACFPHHGNGLVDQR